MDELSAVSVPDMAELRVSGAAVPLLPEYDIGPMLYDGCWWYVAAAGPADAYVPTPPELAGAIRDAGEVTRRQLVVEFGGLLSNDPMAARRRLAKVAAQVNLSNSTLDSFGERSPESQLFAAATSPAR